MIVDVDLVVFNCVFSRALDLNLCYIKDIISHIIVHIILFFEKKAPGRPGGFTQDAASAEKFHIFQKKNKRAFTMN